jgi:membrane protein DedA with SNARE-associated domain
VAREVAALGVWGAVAFLVAYTVLQPFGVPGTVFVVAASLIWPWPIAFALSMTGTMTASVVGFSFARFVARDWVSGRIPPRFRAYDEALAKRGFATVFVLRFVFWMPQVLHIFLGVSRVGFWTHFWGSFAGYLVPLFLVAFYGPRLLDAMRTASPAAGCPRRPRGAATSEDRAEAACARVGRRARRRGSSRTSRRGCSGRRSPCKRRLRRASRTRRSPPAEARGADGHPRWRPVRGRRERAAQPR